MNDFPDTALRADAGADSAMLDDNISADELRGMLALRCAQIEQNLQDEVMRLRYIESRIRQVETEGVLSDYDVVLKPVDTLRALTT